MRNAFSPLARFIVAFIAVFGLIAVALPADAAIDNAVVVPSANTSELEENFLESVSCVTTSWCVAVGYYEDDHKQTLIELWDGNSWSIQNSPNTSSTVDNLLDGVSCVSVSWCVAVGTSDDGRLEQTLIEVWDGTSWSIQASANTSPTEDNGLYSVSCLSAISCVAVGEFDNGWLQTLVQVWDGNTWTIQASENSSTTETNYLFEVSCVSANSCVAVGAFMRGGWNQPMAQVWDGSSWTMQSIPTFSATEGNFVEGLSCVSASMCVAVGAHSINGGSVYQTMIQVWDGNSWSIQPSPSNSLTEDNYLWSVSCVSVSSCVAVGYYYLGGIRQTLVEVWDGSAWAIQPSPNPDPFVDNRLQSVSCVSDWQCVVVGASRPVVFQTLVLSLTGPAPPTTTTTKPTADPVAPAFTG